MGRLRFERLVPLLLNPLRTQPEMEPIMPEYDPTESYILECEDPNLIWNFRGALVVFFVGIVSAPEAVSERVKLRREMDACGLLDVFEAFRKWGTATELVLEHIALYEEDKAEDLEDLEEEYRVMNDGLRFVPFFAVLFIF
jgi:hypothetical protein